MKEFYLLLPEIFLAVTFAGIIGSEIGYHGEKVRLITPTALVGLGMALIQTLLTYRYGATQVFGGTLSIDGFALFFKLFFIVLAGLAILTSSHAKEISDSKRSEYSALIIASALAMCIVSAASDMLLAFLALQCINVLGYLLAAYGKRSVHSTEAAVKYLAFGSVAGAFFLYGIAILFAATHTMNIYEMHKVLLQSPLAHETGLVVFMLIFLSFCFQFSAFPMYLWSPDVMDGSPTPSSAFISLGTRAAGFAVSLRVLVVVFSQPSTVEGQWNVLGQVDWTQIVALIAGVTMVFGSLLAFRQNSAKRMVAYLAVAATGFMLTGLLVLDEVGIAAILYNLVVELFALLGTFYVISLFYDELQSDRLTAYKGMLGRAVPECISLILFLACLVGMPPFAGFIGKFTLIGAAIRHHWYFLAVLAIGSSALGMIAMARLVFSLVGDFREVSGPRLVVSSSHRTILVALFFPMVLVGVFAEQVLHWAGQSLRFIFW